MFRLPSRGGWAERENFSLRPFFTQFFPLRRIYWENLQRGTAMEPEFSHGDVDDLIYQEEWTASER